jgi:hypothetical protein
MLGFFQILTTICQILMVKRELALVTHLGITWKSFVETRLPLLNLPEEIQEALR